MKKMNTLIITHLCSPEATTHEITARSEATENLVYLIIESMKTTKNYKGENYIFFAEIMLS